MSDQLWCPTRGYFTIGGGGASRAAPAAASGEASEPEARAAAAPSGGAASKGGTGAGKAWAPSRGWFEVGSSGGDRAPAAAPKKAAAPKAAAGETPPKKEAPAGAAAAAAAPAAPKAKAAAKKPAASSGDDAPKPKKGAVAADPERESVKAVPALAEGTLYSEAAKALYDDPDSATTLYRVPAMNVLFALSSLLLLIVTIMVLWQDYDREWKDIQADLQSELAKRYQTELETMTGLAYPALAGLEAPLAQMLSNLGAPAGELPGVPDDGDPLRFESSEPRRFRAHTARLRAMIARVYAALEDDDEYARLQQELIAQKHAANTADRILRFDRADETAEKSTQKIETEHEMFVYGDTARGRNILDDSDKEYMEHWGPLIENRARALEVEMLRADEVQEKLDDHVASKTRVPSGDTIKAIEGKLAALLQPIDIQESMIVEIEDSWRNSLRNTVLMDALAPSIKIEKVVVDDLFENLNFLQAPRVDRCKTCHMKIDSVDPIFDDFLSDEWGTVYQSHPRPDLYLQDTSPHPYLTFGCTGCHYGDGRATDFNIVAHTPRDDTQKRDWELRFHWHKKHHQVQPMRKASYIDGSCRKCHTQEDVVDGAETLNLGLDVVRTYGCFGCHRMGGFDVVIGEPTTEGDLWKRPKVAPSLRHIADKVDEGFLFKWIANPWHFRPSTRMPRFFGLSNSTGTMSVLDADGVTVKPLDFDARNDVEALALATYLHLKSSRRELAAPAVRGDATSGRAHFGSLGCLGCHSVKRESESPATPPLAELAARVPEIAGALSASAGALRARGAKPAAIDLAGTYDALARDLVRTSAWFERLPPRATIEGLYTEIQASIETIRRLESRAGVAEAAVDDAATIARGFYDRWVHSTFAPDLSAIASKFLAGGDRARAEAWLSDWILDPSRHDAETVMPRLRLDEDPNGAQAVADIVAYLLSPELRDAEFDAAPALTADSLSSEQQQILKDIAFTNLRTNHPTTEAMQLAGAMSASDQLVYVGHRLIRRYGCFGCHNGIVDEDPDPTATAPSEVDYFDTAQPIGAELAVWGDKYAERLDFGAWGHQPDGSVAIPHNRNDWLDAKLEDTRRFDIFPVRKTVDAEKGIAHYVVSDRLMQKKPDELLKMPLFPFHDDPEMRDAVVTFITSMVEDKIPLSKHHTLTDEKRVIELGARLIRRYNCEGCHRIGVDVDTVALHELPSFFDLGGDDQRRAEMQKETWLADPFDVVRPIPGELKGATLRLPAGFLLNLGALDPAVATESDFVTATDPAARPEDATDATQRVARAAVVEPIPVAELIRRHYDPLPAFVQSVIKSIDQFADEAVQDPAVFRFARGHLADAQSSYQAFLKRINDITFENPALDPVANEAYARLVDKPYDPAVLEYLAESGDDKTWAALALRYYGFSLMRTPPDNQRVAVRGWREGRIRYYFGTDSESRSNAPPPLVRQGERVRDDWLFRFLLDVEPLRAWLKVRMPSFQLTQLEARAIVAWFRATYDLPASNEIFAADRLVDAHAANGAKLFRETLECSKCHPAGSTLPTLPLLAHENGVRAVEVPVSAPDDSFFLAIRDASGVVEVRPGFATADAAKAAGERLPAGTQWSVGQPWSKSNWGPDLSLAAERLRPTWIRDWLASPKDFMPGTKMPHFFGERERFGGDPAAHLLPREPEMPGGESPDQRPPIRDLIQFLVHMRTIEDRAAQPVGGGGN